MGAVCYSFQGLHFIHDVGVIHLDLKPANVFITREGRFKIGDFGMASLWPRPVLTSPTGPEASLRAARTAFEREGDKQYLAPEVLQGRYGKAADMFRFASPLSRTDDVRVNREL
jgi:mitosis inhibitor protein kinase SWE1